MQIGDLGTWISGIVGVIGLVAVFAAYKLSVAMRNDEKLRDSRQQASDISAWVDHLYVPGANGSREEKLGNALILRNASGSAVYDVAAEVTIKGQKIVRFASKVCPPGEYFTRYLGHDKTAPFPWELMSDAHSLECNRRPYSVTKDWSVVSLSFRDGRGNCWERGATGVLTARELADN